MTRTYDGDADDAEVAEPFRWVSPREITESWGDPEGGGAREPRSPLPTKPNTSAGRNLPAA